MDNSAPSSPAGPSPDFDPDFQKAALASACRKAYWRLLPLLFLCYVIAYVDRNNIAIAKLTMAPRLGFLNDVVGLGAGLFFIGYFLLEIPGTLLVEKWSARKWICRIMVTWGLIEIATAWISSVETFYFARFMLGLAEAGFFPGVIVYIAHWFPREVRAKAFAWFMIGTPIAQMIQPVICQPLILIGEEEVKYEKTAAPFTPFWSDPKQPDQIAVVHEHHPQVAGLYGWQWIFIISGVPAVVLGVVVLFWLTDRPKHARWLTEAERNALENALHQDKQRSVSAGGGHMGWLEALKHPKVLLLAAAYFFVVTGNYAIENFLPSILKDWYKLEIKNVLWLVVLPPIGALFGQLLVGWSSDQRKERRLHTSLPIYFSVLALIAVVLTKGQLWLSVLLFILVATGLKAYLPAFWSLPSLFLVEAAAASSIGFINSVGNLGGFVGPYLLGGLETWTGSYVPGLAYLCVSMTISATIVICLGLGKSGKD